MSGPNDIYAIHKVVPHSCQHVRRYGMDGVRNARFEVFNVSRQWWTKHYVSPTPRKGRTMYPRTARCEWGGTPYCKKIKSPRHFLQIRKQPLCKHVQIRDSSNSGLVKNESAVNRVFGYSTNHVQYGESDVPTNDKVNRHNVRIWGLVSEGEDVRTRQVWASDLANGCINLSPRLLGGRSACREHYTPVQSPACRGDGALVARVSVALIDPALLGQKRRGIMQTDGALKGLLLTHYLLHRLCAQSAQLACSLPIGDPLSLPGIAYSNFGRVLRNAFWSPDVYPRRRWLPSAWRYVACPPPRRVRPKYADRISSRFYAQGLRYVACPPPRRVRPKAVMGICKSTAEVTLAFENRSTSKLTDTTPVKRNSRKRSSVEKSQITHWDSAGDRGGVVVRLLDSHQGESGSTTGGATPVFSHVGIVLDDAAGQRLYFSEIFRFPHSCISALLHTFLASPLSALKTSL
ncbi:hypothetical protein PR048_021738 [Dryococelus australis]|uniref:Uncharacterized protein n=1 Tax=Dryococelus australis TaxID=614101 RepID=A0ABQ9GZ08_9NEOP|nr:hypothetical protein PR048_021738 [Dryococelus australis]